MHPSPPASLCSLHNVVIVCIHCCAWVVQQGSPNGRHGVTHLTGQQWQQGKETWSARNQGCQPLVHIPQLGCMCISQLAVKQQHIIQNSIASLWVMGRGRACTAWAAGRPAAEGPAGQQARCHHQPAGRTGHTQHVNPSGQTHCVNA
jgi:hypothetical protein